MAVLPLIERVKTNLPAPEVYCTFKDLPYSFLLDTGMEVSGLGHHSFAGALPFLVLEAKNGIIRINREGKYRQHRGDPLEMLQRILAEQAFPPVRSDFPFHGGAVGYFSYDLGRHFEKLPEQARDDLVTPDLCLGFYDVFCAVDVRDNSVCLVSTGRPYKGRKAEDWAYRRLQRVKQMLAERPRNFSAVPGKAGSMYRDFDRRGYMRAVQKVIDYIYAGDIFQANLSQRFALDYEGDTWSLYLALRRINPAPFAAYLNFGSFRVLCSSPERFLKVEGSRVETRPIKGTRPRGRTPAEDRELQEELLNSEKDRAELMMIVDLERNDLGRVCQVGSVKVPQLFRLEEYATVFHLVSTVEGILPGDKGVVDVLRAAFPGGSITGAPKIRAMEIIEELEPVRRGIYTGSIGYIGFDGVADLNIVIRTIIAKGKKLYFQVGGGITADSQPAAEYRETIDKARALIRALGLDEAQVVGENG